MLPVGTRVIIGDRIGIVDAFEEPVYSIRFPHSPLIVRATPEHEELKAIAKGCVTRFHCHHYFGFAANQWKLFAKEDPPRVKPLLYVYRVLLNGHPPDAQRRDRSEP